LLGYDAITLPRDNYDPIPREIKESVNLLIVKGIKKVGKTVYEVRGSSTY